MDPAGQAGRAGRSADRRAAARRAGRVLRRSRDVAPAARRQHHRPRPRGREGDQHRNTEREDELRRASQLINAGYRVPAELFPAIADVIELDLEDRRQDAERDPAAEELLAEIHEQLLFRAPARDYTANATTGN